MLMSCFPTHPDGRWVTVADEYLSDSCWLWRVHVAVRSMFDRLAGKNNHEIFAREERKVLRGLLDGMPNQIFFDKAVVRRSGIFVDAFINCLNDVEECLGNDGFWFATDESIDDLRSALLLKLDSDAFRQSWSRVRRPARRNRRSLLRYFSNLKIAYPKLLMSRLDLHFPWLREACVRRDEIHEFIDAWLELVRAKFPAMVGYCLRLEFGVDRGPHVHTVFAFNGSELRNHVAIAKVMGDLWVQVVPNGSSFNCNVRGYASRMRWKAIGMIYDGDNDFFTGLRHLVRYLTDYDPIIKGMLPENSRTLRKGGISRVQRRRIIRRERRLCDA